MAKAPAKAPREQKGKKDGKGLFVALLIGAGGLAAWAMGGKKPGEQPGASIAIAVLDAATGLPVPHHSPAAVIEGGSYIAQATVTNKSTKQNQPVAATLTVKFYGFAGGFPDLQWPLPGQRVQAFNFTAGQVGTVSCPFIVQDGTAGQVGEVGAWVETPNAVELARAREPLTIQSAAIVYAAGITVKVV